MRYDKHQQVVPVTMVYLHRLSGQTLWLQAKIVYSAIKIYREFHLNHHHNCLIHIQDRYQSHSITNQKKKKTLFKKKIRKNTIKTMA